MCSSDLACDFCSKFGKSLADLTADAGLVVVGRLHHADQDAQTTQLDVLFVVKLPDAARAKKSFVVSRFLPIAREGDSERLIFGDLVQGRVDPSLMQTIDSPDLVGYLRESIRLQRAEPVERFTYYFHHLQHADPAISEDAYKEFGKASYPEVAAGKPEIGRAHV